LTKLNMFKWLWVSLVVVFLDQYTKFLISSQLDLYQVVKIMPSFQFHLMHNRGAAFSFLSEAAGWQRWFFTAIAIGVSIFILFWLKRLTNKERWMAIALCLILGGAAGNVLDRIVFGYVVDFVEIYYGSWSWPAFNIADSAITAGATMAIIDALREVIHKKQNNTSLHG